MCLTGALGILYEGRILVAIVSSGEVYCSKVCALLVLEESCMRVEFWLLLFLVERSTVAGCVPYWCSRNPV